MRIANNSIKLLAGWAITIFLVSCNGVFSGIYDDISEQTTIGEGQLYVDATSWRDWYYVDFDSLQQLVEQGKHQELVKAQTTFMPYPIPIVSSSASSESNTGIYTYWFDVFGKGISNNEKRAFTPTTSQPEPSSWTLSFHRNNVRTNGGAVLETHYTSFDQLPPNSSEFTGATFSKDEWSETEVWADQSQMFQSLVGCQGININKVLSSWLRLDIPPMPPLFTLNSHVFILRLQNGRYAAIQLQNYMNTEGTKCWLTINYKYPY